MYFINRNFSIYKQKFVFIKLFLKKLLIRNFYPKLFIYSYDKYLIKFD